MRYINVIFLSILIFCSLADNKLTGSTRKETNALNLKYLQTNLIQLHDQEVKPKFLNSSENIITQNNQMNIIL